MYNVIKTLPKGENVVGMKEINGVLYIATTKRVFKAYVKEGDYKLHEMTFYLTENTAA